jgi:regulator of sigma E protease
MSLLTIILATLVTIGVLVTFHEWGHFWVARKLGVKVLRFSIGFGKPLWTKRGNDPDHIEYMIAALPLGGYVKMLDERECEEGQSIPETDLPRAFNRQPIWKRAAIVAAGPIANFLLAIILYTLVFILGQETRYAYVDVLPNTPAASAGFQAGDLVTAINQKPVSALQDVPLLLIDQYMAAPDKLVATVRTQEGFEKNRILNLQGSALLKQTDDILERVGLIPWTPAYPLKITVVAEQSPAAQAGLKIGDVLQQAAGQPVNSFTNFLTLVKSHENQALTLKVLRADQTLDMTVTPKKTNKGQIQVGLGFASPPESLIDKLYFKQSYSPLEALQRGVQQTWDMSVMSLQLMGRIFTGEVSVDNISGVITIAQVAGKAATIGFVTFLSFLAIFSVSLGLLNLMPIPMLDGGHLLYYLIEAVKGSPLSEQAESVGLRIGMAIIGALMVLALYNDFMRLMK